MNLSAMRKLVYALADEDAGGSFNPTTVDTFINAGVKRVARSVPSIVATKTVDYVPGDGLIYLDNPTIEGRDCVVERVSITDRALAKYDYATLTSVLATGSPSGYYVRGAAVGLYPTPDAQCVVAVDYQQDPDDLVSDSSAPMISNTLCELACKYAVYLLKLADDEYNTADRWKLDFDRSVIDHAGPRAGHYKAV